jgi:phospholipid/cholesterol/gamma-HCH transport system substrate-binding protein
MQATRAEKARLGAFLVVGIGLILASLFYLVGRKWMTETVPYAAVFEESVTGLEPGSPVKQNGVDIGTVINLGTDGDDITKTIVNFTVDKGIPVKSDMVASLGSYGITGMKYIEVTGGNYSSSNLPPHGRMRTSMSTLGRITSRADSIALKIDQLLGNAIELTQSQNRQHLNRLVESSVRLSEAMDSLVRDVQAIRPGQRIGGILEHADEAMKDMQAKVHKADIGGTIQEYRKAAEGVNQVTERMDVTVRRMQEDLAVTMSQMKEAMKNMNTFSRQIKDNPSVLLRGEDKQERQR